MGRLNFPEDDFEKFEKITNFVGFCSKNLENCYSKADVLRKRIENLQNEYDEIIEEIHFWRGMRLRHFRKSIKLGVKGEKIR